MLVLTRRAGEEIVIGGTIRLSVVAVRGNRVQIGIRAPRSVPVQRAELEFAQPEDDSPLSAIDVVGTPLHSRRSA